MKRYLRLLAVQLRASLATAMQYRLDFVVQGSTELFWTSMTFVPIFAAFSDRQSIGGWTFPESLLVLGFFMLLRSVLEGSVSPSLNTVVEHIRKGTLDFVLLKPADAQFLVSTAKFDVSALFGTAGGLGLIGWSLHAAGRMPTIGGTLLAVLLAIAGVGLLYSGWILIVASAFSLVKIDNLGYLLVSTFDAARWPATVFRGFWRVLFTFVIPLAVMTTFPAEALLGKIDPERAALSLLATAVFAVAARQMWLRALSKYTSAGG